MWLSTLTVLNEHLPSLHHLNVVVFSQWLGGINIEKGPDSPQYPLNVLGVRLKLVRADPMINLFQNSMRVFRCT